MPDNRADTPGAAPMSTAAEIHELTLDRLIAAREAMQYYSNRAEHLEECILAIRGRVAGLSTDEDDQSAVAALRMVDEIINEEYQRAKQR